MSYNVTGLHIHIGRGAGRNVGIRVRISDLVYRVLARRLEH